MPDAIKLMRTASTKYGAADAPKTSIPRTIAVIGVLIAAAKTHTNPIAAKLLFILFP